MGNKKGLWFVQIRQDQEPPSSTPYLHKTKPSYPDQILSRLGGSVD